jgi:hypothetical protein
VNPICLLFTNIVKDISVGHHLRDHRELSGLWLDFDCNELMDVWMRRIHPHDAFLAEGLDLVLRSDQSSRITRQAAFRTS